jgi:hypothetical protein
MNLNLVYLIPFMLYIILFAFANNKTDKCKGHKQ